MSDTIQSVKDLPEVSFIDNDTLEAMKTRMVANFESEWKRITGQEITLSPSDPNRIMLYAISLELYQDEQYIDRAGKQDLIKYSYGEFLDNLGAGRGVTRKQPAPAETTLRFTLSEKRPAAVGISEGTKVTDGNLNYFATVGYEEIPAGETYVDVRALCTENGVDGNELLPGQVNVLVDLIPYVESVSNTTKTSGGADLESDESLAERIFLAPSGYSVAGPDDAYKYWTKTYSQTIGDVKVTSPNPVEVEIRFIMTDGELPTKTVIDGVAAYLQDENIRPLTDKVTVLAPETVKFNIAFTYYVNLSDQSKAVLGEIKAKGLEFETEISKPTLYSYIDKGIFLTITNKELPVKGRRKKKNKKVRRQARANAGTSIEKRPEDIDTREEFGHWEMDTVVGKRGESKHSLLVLTERKTRNELIYLLYEHTTEQVCKRLDQLEAEWGERFGQVFKTITVDNGSEFADWEGMQQSAADESEKRVTVFYCHPYCSFERGSNENQNRLVRRKIPKGENFDDRTEDDIQRVEDWINDYPREMFGWKTSGELFQEELARLA